MGRIFISSLIMGGWLLASCLAAAQNVRGSFGFFQLGYLYAPQAGTIAHTFTPDWFPPLTNHFIYSGAEGWLRRKHWVAGLSATAMTARSVTSQQTRIDRSTGIGQLKIGYVFVDHRKWMAYSSVGHGFSSMLVSVETTGCEPSVWMLPSRSTDLAIHVQKLLVADKTTKNHTIKGLWLGLRLGYITSARSFRWQQIPDGIYQENPPFALRGFYATMTIGGGHFQYLNHP